MEVRHRIARSDTKHHWHCWELDVLPGILSDPPTASRSPPGSNLVVFLKAASYYSHLGEAPREWSTDYCEGGTHPGLVNVASRKGEIGGRVCGWIGISPRGIFTLVTRWRNEQMMCSNSIEGAAVEFLGIQISEICNANFAGWPWVKFYLQRSSNNPRLMLRV